MATKTLWALFTVIHMHDNICFTNEMRFRIRSMNVRMVCVARRSHYIVLVYNFVSKFILKIVR